MQRKREPAEGDGHVVERERSGAGKAFVGVLILVSSMRKRALKNWTEEEIERLKELYPNPSLTIAEIANILNKPYGSVVWAAYKLKLKRKSGNYTARTPKYLKPIAEKASK